MEEMEWVWEEMFRSNAAAVVARLHSHLRACDRPLSSLLLSHAIAPPRWLLPDPADANEPAQIHGDASTFLPPPQAADVLASQRETGLDVHTGHDEPLQDNDEEPVCANGIPNTITKYKEDQKIVWHGTPFEVRVEKVLSDEKHLPRKQG